MTTTEQFLAVLYGVLMISVGAALGQTITGQATDSCTVEGSNCRLTNGFAPNGTALSVAFDPHGRARALLVDNDGYVLAHCEVLK